VTGQSIGSTQAAELANVAAEAATCVADDLRAAFRRGMDVDVKRDLHDPVTEHDRRAERRIREVILSRVPDSTIVGEEGGSAGSGSVHWYVDPIDGTANFAGGLAFFCTSVGAVVDGRVVAGAINDPMSGNLFTATEQDAWCNGQVLQSRGAATESTAMLVTSYPSNRVLETDRGRSLDHLGQLIDAYRTVRRVGSAALTLAHVAAGWLDAAFGVGINAWDVSVGSLLLHAAGGRYQPLWPGGAVTGPEFTAPGYLATVADLDLDVLARVIDEITAGPGSNHPAS
jgi:myo-inositol-1(or 4)-monophosphatase